MKKNIILFTITGVAITVGMYCACTIDFGNCFAKLVVCALCLLWMALFATVNGDYIERWTQKQLDAFCDQISLSEENDDD